MLPLLSFSPLTITSLSGMSGSAHLFYFALLPLVVILLMRKNPLDFGLRLGSPRIWGFWVIITCIIAGIILYGVSFMPSLQDYYEIGDFHFFKYFWTSCISLAASEFMFRGYLIFGLKDKLKEGSIIIQMIPFVLLHLGKTGNRNHQHGNYRHPFRVYRLQGEVLLAGFYHPPVYQYFLRDGGQYILEVSILSY